MATRVERYKVFINGYIRELYSSKHVPNDITDLVFLFYSLIIGSEMLTKEEDHQLMEWIDGSNGCDFKLLYKATRDGFGGWDFHEKCDGKGANISIVKSDNECIFGGYTAKSWNSDGHSISDDCAWLYSLRNKKGIQKKFKIVKNYGKYAMHGWSDHGPVYGTDALFVSNDCNEDEYSYTYLGMCYRGGGASDPHQLNDGTQYFKVLDYEIWQIIKK